MNRATATRRIPPTSVHASIRCWRGLEPSSSCSTSRMRSLGFGTPWIAAKAANLKAYHRRGTKLPGQKSFSANSNVTGEVPEFDDANVPSPVRGTPTITKQTGEHHGGRTKVADL